MSAPQTSRRTVLAAAGAAGLVTALAACQNSGDDGDGYGSGDSEDEHHRDEDGEHGPHDGPHEGDRELARTDEIPPSGGRVFRDEKVVVVQPSDGEFEAYSARCTHKGCLVSSVRDGTINCPCHGSRYRIEDGSVASGPAREPLPRERISVRRGTITLD